MAITRQTIILRVLLLWFGCCLQPVHGWTLNRRQVIAGAAGITTVATGAIVARALVPSDPPQIYTPAPGALKDQTIVITGGTTGLGLESVKRLAAGGANVIFTARSETKGEAAVKSVQEYLAQLGIDNPSISYKVLDLDNLETVKAVPETWKDIEKVDVLLNNAGVMAIPDRQLTVDGYERTIQSNHLGHFALTSLLASKLASDARIINVSSAAHTIAGKGLLSQDALWKPNLESYSAWGAYGQSKLANVLFTQELQRRSDAAGLKWTVVSLHPGAIKTDLVRYIIGEDKFQKMKEGALSPLENLALKVLNSFVKDVPEGATTQVWLASRGDLESNQDVRGQYCVDCKVKTLDGFATDRIAAERLWSESEQRSGVDFKL